ncbi:site-specific integrase [Devosia ginsengisoli]|uniref:site-specific integrase n=1 Tax=Devosia ginsengisoli TaxID=400770 RepID=UPI0026F24E1C|nr:site-specific integrase [Devosia ginsengisoli]MCR6673213.1 site-specific integrase [Devosia ginsengisoli]
MGSITERQRASGTPSFLAQIMIKRGGKVIHRESLTFERRPAAAAWIRQREAELKRPGAAELAAEQSAADRDEDNPLLADVIEYYVSTSRKALGKTKSQVLSAIQRMSIAKHRCRAVGSPQIIEWLEELAAGGRHKSTVGSYLSHLAAIARIAKPAWNVPLDYQAVVDARIVASRLGLIGKSKKRTRRPTLAELAAILTHLNARPRGNYRGAVPVSIIVLFAIFSTRRLDEICRIRWEDFEPQNSRVLVRDMKNPGEKEGNDVWVTLPPEAVEIIQMMPRGHERIFPHNGDSVSAAFTRACPMVGVVDLRFHDMRHEGVSRLFEMGWKIPDAALVSGHRSWSSLQRYSHIRQSGDKYANWPWRSYITKRPAQILTLDRRCKERKAA